MKTFFLPVIITVFVFLPQFAAAQPDSVNYDSLANLGLKDLLNIKVSGVSKTEEHESETPANVIVYSKEQIELAGFQDLSDLLKNVPGIDFVDYARGCGEFYIFRGIEGNDRFLVLIDGQKINPASGTFLSVGNSISLGFAERVEIIFGPASVMYGADAFSGIVNIVSKRAKNKLDISGGMDYGTMNTLQGNVSAMYKPSENFDILLSTRFFESDGPDFTERDTNFQKIQNYAAPLRNSFEQPIKDHTFYLRTRYKNLSLTFFRQYFDEGNAFGQFPDRNVYNKENKWETDNNILDLNYEKSILRQSSIKISCAFINHNQLPETQFYKINIAQNPPKPFSQYITGRDNSLRSQVVFNTALFQKIKLVGGVEYEYTESIPPYANDEVLAKSVKFEGENATIIEERLTISEQRIAGFAQANYDIFKRIKLFLGGRYDYSQLNGYTFNPRLGLIFNPGAKFYTKLMYGTAFQAPSLFYRYEQWGAAVAVMQSTNEVRKTNPGWQLKNQEVETFEADAGFFVRDNLKLALSIYHNNLDNLIERAVFTDSAYNKYFSTAQDSVFSKGYRNENIGKQRTAGFDFTVDYGVNKNISISATYSFLDAFSIKNTGNEDVPRIARHKLRLNYSMINLFKYFNLSLDAQYYDRLNNRNNVVYPDGKQPGYLNIDATIRLSKLVKYITFYARIENALNSKYDHGGMVDQVLYMPVSPQPGIVVRGGVELKIN